MFQGMRFAGVSHLGFLILDKFPVCVSISLVRWGSHGLYVVMNGGVLSFLLSLSTSVCRMWA